MDGGGVKGKSLVAALLLAGGMVVAIRLVGLGSSPPGLYADEASIGYNALSILRTGRDEHGRLLPLYFEAFGEYKNPVFIYASVPAVAVLGPEPRAIRGVAAIFGIGTCLLVGLGVFRVTRDPRWGMAGFVVAGLLPWLVLPSRVAFEAVTLPFFLLLGWLLWDRAVESKRISWFILSGLAHGLAFYAYSTGRLVAPLHLLVLASTWRGSRRWGGAAAAGAFVVALLPALIWSITHPGSLGGRFAEVGVFARADGWSGAGLRVLLNLVRYCSPAFLFTDGDPILRHHTGTGGVLYLFLLPGLLRGILGAAPRSAPPRLRSLLFLCLLFPLVPSLTHRSFHLLRSIHAAPLLAILAVAGTREVFRRWRRGVKGPGDGKERSEGEGRSPPAPPGGEEGRPDGAWRGAGGGKGGGLLVFLVLASAALEIPHYVYDLYRKYPTRAELHFQEGVGEVVIAARAGHDGPIYYDPSVFRDESGKVNHPEIHFLFRADLDPAVYQREGLSGFGIFPWTRGAAVPPGSRVIVGEEREDGDWSFVGTVPLAKGTGRRARIFRSE